MALFLIVLMLLLSAFFSGSEIAFVTANRLKAEVRAHREGAVGGVVREFIREPSKYLTTTLVGNNVALVLYSMLMALYLEGPLAGTFGGWLGPDAEGAVTVLVLAAQTVIASSIVLVFGEIIPKSLFREPADRLVFAAAVPLKLTYYLFLPAIWLAGWVSQRLARLFGIRGESFQQFLRGDYEAVVRESREAGTLDLDEEESAIISNVFEFQSTRVKDVMVPRTGIEGVSEDATMGEVRARFVETGFSRLPVFRDNVDHVVGLVKAHDLFDNPAALADVVREVPFVPESKRAKDLLYDLLASGTPMAVAIDEYGGTAGIITVEDLLEELFGEIRDEYDPADPEVRALGDGAFVVSGRSEIGVLDDEHGLRLPEGDYDTVAGLLLNHLSSIPKPRDEVEIGGYHFTVLEASASRIDRVRIERTSAPPTDHADGP